MTVTAHLEDGVLVVTLDDGKVNAISRTLIDGLHAALDRAAAEATAVCLCGNDRAFSAGFDLAVMNGAADGRAGLVAAGAELLQRLYLHPQPTVAAVTGHALAAGALVVLACDTRVGTRGPAQIGLNEVTIGLTLPDFALDLARARLSESHLTRATVQAEIYDPAGAVVAGYLDRTEPDCRAWAVTEARRLGRLPAKPYAATKLALRQPRHAT